MRTGRSGTPPRSVALVRALRGLGDMLCAVPALRSLRAALPEARLALVGLPGAAWLLERFPHYLDEFVEFPGFPGIPEVPYDPARLAEFVSHAQGRFDLTVQLHGSGTNSNSFAALLGARITAGYYLPALWCPDPEFFLPYEAHSHEIHRWLELLEFLGIPRQGDHLEFPELPGDREQLEAVWPARGDAPYACLHPGAFEPERRWPAERFAAVGDALAAHGLTVVLTGGSSERELTDAVARRMEASAVDLAGRTSLGALAALLRDASLLVSNDTGVSHLAVAVDAPSVVIFAASDPGRWAPLDRERHRVLGRIMPHRSNACLHTPEIRGHRCLRDACSSLVLPTTEEWEPATVEEVLREASALLDVRG